MYIDEEDVIFNYLFLQRSFEVLLITTIIEQQISENIVVDYHKGTIIQNIILKVTYTKYV